MEFLSPHRNLRTCTARDDDVLWRPGSTAYPCSPTRKHLDRLRSEQNLQKLYEDTPDCSYDLSLTDIVDPCYSISGNLKAIVADTEAKSNTQTDAGKSCSRKGASSPKLRFSFSFPGLRGKSRSARPNLFAWKASPLLDGKDGAAEVSASKRSLSANLSPSKYSHDHGGINPADARTSSMSRIHPSNQCSTCSSYTIFFKCRCLVCGRLYCSICTKEHMENLSEGYKCKNSCQNGPLRKRLSRKLGSGCWPFLSSSDLQRLPPTYG